MELVKGTPITEFCDIRKMTPRERLELFVPVCHAIQHAHQKGIIHRDIKPSNVLVALHDENPVAKVIDFGLAKAFGQQLTEKTLYTAFGSLIGTPAYMAPEQAMFNQLDIDTRADVYALGVLLYELLTGSPPVEPERLREAALDEVLRIVRDEDPIRPSLRLSTSEARAKIAQTRQSDPSRLSALMRGELDWIVMKALEKDRTRRYEGASDLAKDVQRYLTGDAVEACSPTLAYRFSKFVKRNRPQVAAAALVLGALLVGIAGTTYGLIRAERQRAIAAEERASAVAALEEAKLAAKKETAQRVRAENAINRTLDVLDQVTSYDMLEGMITQREISDGQKQFLDVVLNHFEEVAQEKGQDEATRFRTAKAADRVGEIQLTLGRFHAGSVSAVRAKDGFAELVAEFPENNDYHYHLAQSWHSIGHLRIVERDFEGADEAWNRAAREYERLIDVNPKIIQSAVELARLLVSHGRLLAGPLDRQADGDRLLERAVKLMEQKSSEHKEREVRSALAFAYEGAVFYSEADLSKKQTMAWKSFDIRKQLSDERPESFYAQRAHARSGWTLGWVHAYQEQWTQAEKWFREAVDIHRDLLKHFPNVPRMEYAVGYSLTRLAYVLEKQERWSDAERLYLEALPLKERQVRELGDSLGMEHLDEVYSDTSAGGSRSNRRGSKCL